MQLVPLRRDGTITGGRARCMALLHTLKLVIGGAVHVDSP
jgi:hypothetical protein